MIVNTTKHGGLGWRRASVGKLPAVSSLPDPALLGASTSASVPYRPHPQDQAIRAAMEGEESKLLVLHGAAGSGRHRVAFAAIHTRLPDYLVFRPRDVRQLWRFVRSAPADLPTVVWVDQIDLECSEGSAEALTTLLDQRDRQVVVVVLLNTAVYSRYIPAPLSVETLHPRRRQVARLLDRAVAFEITNPPPPAVAAWYEWLCTTHPAAAEIVATCMAWQLAGARSVPRSVLHAAFSRRFGFWGGFWKALWRASQDLDGVRGFSRQPGGTYAVDRRLLESAYGRAIAVPGDLWHQVIREGSGRDAFDTGMAAWRLTSYDGALEAFEKAAALGAPEASHLYAVVTGEAGWPKKAAALLTLLDETDGERRVWLRMMKANCLGEAGRHLFAVAELEVLLREPDCRDGSIVAFCAEHYRCRWLCEAGRVHEGLFALETLRESFAATYPNRYANLLDIHHTIAYWTSRLCWESSPPDRHWLEDSVRLFDQLIAGYNHSFGDNHPAALRARNDRLRVCAELALELHDQEGLRAIVEEMAKLERQASRLLGRLNLRTLEIRGNRYWWMAVAGNVPKAIHRLHDLIRDCHATLGPAHTYTLETRRNHAYWLAQAARVPGTAPSPATLELAIRDLESVIQTVRDSRVSDHPLVTDALRQLGELRERLGETRMVGEMVHLAIQPMYQPNDEIAGFGLFFLPTAAGDEEARRDVQAISQVIVHAFATFDLPAEVGGMDLYIDITREFLTGDLRVPVDPGRVVLEVVETVEYDSTTIEGVRRLTEEGFRVAIDAVHWDSAGQARQHVSHVKIDLRKIDGRTAKRIAAACLTQPRPPLLIGYGIDGEQELAFAHELGCHLLQGGFLEHPRVLSAQVLPSLDSNRMRLAASLIDLEKVDLREVIAGVEADPGLTSIISRWCAATGAQTPITSAEDAVTTAGLAKVRDLAMLLAVTPVAGADHGNLVKMLTWGLMGESVARRMGVAGGKAFLASLIVEIASYLGRPVADVAAEHHLAPDMVSAVVDRQGQLGQVLNLIAMYRSGCVDAAAAAVSNADLRTMHLDAFREAVAVEAAL
ncbi:MAG: EAL domain-containing protein, partial [Micromonosporaceae bacterium]|nr:EAL domain-containing protein [Micromonosporaceae bacterium]